MVRKTARAHWFDVRDFGAAGDGTADDSRAVQRAIDAHSAFSWVDGMTGAVYFPPGIYAVSKTVAAADRQGLRFVGAGRLLSTIFAGTGGVCVDATGIESFHMGGLWIVARGAAPSTVGVLLARSDSRRFVDGHHLSDCRIDMGSDPNANGGAGRIGVYNNAAEVGLLSKVDISGDRPLVMIGNNVLGVVSSLVPHYAGASSMSTCVVSSCGLRSDAGRPSVLMENAVACTIRDSYLSSGVSGAAAVELAGANIGCEVSGHVEGFQSAVSTRSNPVGLNVRVTMSMTVGVPAVVMDGPLSGLVGGRVDVVPVAGAGRVLGGTGTARGVDVVRYPGQT